MCYGAIVVATDYDSGLVAEGKIKPVSTKEIIKMFGENIGKVKKLMLKMIEHWPAQINCSCQKALESARF